MNDLLSLNILQRKFCIVMELNSLANAFMKFNIYFLSSFYIVLSSHMLFLKTLPEPDFQRVAEGSSMDPLPSKTPITGENNFKKTQKQTKIHHF